MIQFKSSQDLQKLDPGDPAYPVVKQQIQYIIEAYDSPEHPYIAEDYGWVILIQQGDENRPLIELWDDGDKLEDLMWEGAYKDGNFVIASGRVRDQAVISAATAVAAAVGAAVAVQAGASRTSTATGPRAAFGATPRRCMRST